MKMKIYAYRVEQVGPRALDNALMRIEAALLRERQYLGEREMRLETSEERNGFWFADFAVPRTGHGPGRMSRDAPLAEIALDAGFSFGEDTGIAFDPNSGYLAVQYNHFGPRISSIEKYLLAADISFGGQPPLERGQRDEDRYGYKFGMVLRPDAYARLRQWGIFKSVDVTISAPGALAVDLQAGRSLKSVLDAPLPEGVETITLGITARPGKDSSLDERGVQGWIQDIQHLGGAVSRAVVRGKPTEDDRMDSVNLVKDRVSAEATLTLGNGLRFVRQDRWDALGRTLRQWLDEGRLPQAAN